MVFALDDSSLLSSVFEQAPAAIALAEFDPDGAQLRIVQANEAFRKLMGRERATGVLNVGTATCGDAPVELSARLLAGRRARWETVLPRRRTTIEWSFSPIRHRSKRVTHVIAIARDVTQARREAERLSYLANHDALTGLLTRAPFEATLERLVQRAERDWQGAVLLADVDRFKQVNDRFGHQAGDALLRAVGSRLTSALRPGDVLARLGGDEFGILLEQVSLGRAEEIAQRCRAAVCAQPLDFGEHRIGVTVSLGLAPIESGLTPGELVRRADAALYAAKSGGRDRVSLDQSPIAVRRSQTAFATRVEAALRTGAVEVRYLPVRALADGDCEGVMAVPRLVDGDGLFAPPTAFRPVAEKLGAIPDVETRALEVVLDALGDRDHPRVFVDLSIETLRDADARRRVVALLETHDGAGRLVARLRASELTQDVRAVHTWLRALPRTGLRLTVTGVGGDAGTYRYLEALPVDYVEFDLRLTGNAPLSTGDRAILRALVTLAHERGHRVIVPGVVDAAGAAQLAALGVDCGRGPLWGSPRRSARPVALR